MKYLLALLQILCMSVFAFGQDAVYDTLWLKNGEMLYGEFKSLDVGVITFDAEVIDDVKVKHYEAATMKATSNFYRMRSLAGKDYFGWILPGDTGQVIIYNLLDSIKMPLSRLVFVSAYDDNFLERWSGAVSAGYSYTKSSDIGRINLDFSVNYKSDDQDFDLSASTIVTSENDTFYREREEATITYNRYFYTKWSGFGALTYQRNQTLGLRYRVQAGAGITFTQYLTNQMRFSVGAGMVRNNEENFENESLSSYEVPVLLTFRFFRYRDPSISLVFSNSVYTGITEVGRIRQDGELTLNWELIDDLSLNLKLYDSYDSQSPSTGEALLDYGVVSGLSYSF